MNFKPCNRYLLLKELAEDVEPEKPTILVPDDYKVRNSPYAVYEVLDAAADCTKVALNGATPKTKVLVNNTMVEEAQVHGESLFLVLENHVYGVLE